MKVMRNILGGQALASLTKRTIGSARLSRHVATTSIGFVVAAAVVTGLSTTVNAADPCQGRPDRLTAPGYLYPGEMLCSSEGGNQAYNLQFQADCNVVLLTGRYKPLWSTSTYGRSCTSSNSCLAMQGDGNFVLYWPNGCGGPSVLWQSGTGNQPSATYCVVVQIDGNVVVYIPPCNYGGAPLIGPGLPSWTQSSHTRPIQGADSWRTQPIIEGRASCAYPCHSTNLYFRAIDRYSSRQPGWITSVQAGVSAWNQSPVFYSFTPQPNDTQTWIYASFPGDTPGNCGSFLGSGAYGVTIDYDQFGNPSSTWQAMSIYFTDVCLNQNNLPSSGGALLQNVTAHELGHTVGLAHNFRDSTSLMWPYGQTSVLGPSSNDWGSPAPGCPNRDATYGGLGGGAMCIYGWGD